VRARQFEIATTLTFATATATLLNVPPVTVQFDLRLGDVFDEMIVKAAGFFQVFASTVRTAFQPHVVINRVLIGRRRLAKHARMFAMRRLAAIRRFLGPFLRVRLGRVLLTAAFQFRFEFGVARLQFVAALSKFRIIPLQLGNARKQFFHLSSQFIHGLRSLPSNPECGKTNHLTVTGAVVGRCSAQRRRPSERDRRSAVARAC
jgi:hypothetical protein